MKKKNGVLMLVSDLSGFFFHVVIISSLGRRHIKEMIRLLCFGHSILVVKSFAILPIHTIDVVRSDLVTINILPWLSVYFIISWKNGRADKNIDRFIQVLYFKLMCGSADYSRTASSGQVLGPYF